MCRLLGRARAEAGQTDDAIDAYRTAVTLDDQDAWTFNNLGVLDIGQGLAEDAVGALARAADLKPDVATFHNNLGMALEQTGYFESAQDQYRMAVQADSTYQKAAANLQRIDGWKDKAGLPPLDLPGLEQKFLEQVIKRSKQCGPGSAPRPAATALERLAMLEPVKIASQFRPARCSAFTATRWNGDSSP